MNGPTPFLVFIAVSLDGFIARADGRLDWLPGADPDSAPMPPGEDYGYDAFMARVDTLVMGRATFEKGLTFPQWPYGDKRVVVLSRTLRQEDIPDTHRSHVTLHPGPVPALARQLETEGVSGVYVDGGQTIQSFLRAGLIDELILTRIPVLIGQGLPLFGPLDADLPLRHVQTRAFEGSGFVQSVYRRVAK